ncbi:MAG: prolyl oligopeptidase family serine peptidase [bacterium]
MNMRCTRHTSARVLLSLVIMLLMPLTGWAQGTDKRPLTHDDYDGWKSIRGDQISPDGRWASYQVEPQEGDGELVVRSLRDGSEYRHPRGQRAAFTEDGRFLLFLVAPPEDSLEAAREAKKKGPDLPQDQLAIMTLADGSVTTVERVQNFRLPEEAGGWVAYLKEEPTSEAKKAEAGEEPEQEEGEEEKEEEKEKEKEKEYGTELVLRRLDDGTETTFASVLEYRFTEEGGYLLYIVSSEEDPDSDGVYAHRPEGTDPQPLLTGEGNYRRWTLNEEESLLAFVTDRDDYDAEEPTFNLYGWRVGEPAASLWVSHTSTPGFTSGFAVSEHSGLSFTEEAEIVKFGIKEIPEPDEEDEEEEDDEKEEAGFELWSWNDPYPYPQQKQMEDRYRNRTFDAVYHLEGGRFVQLGDEEMWSVRLSEDGRVGFGQTDMPYRERISYDSAYYDFYLVDPATGERTLIKEESYFRGNLSPEGRYVTWFGTDRHWHVHDIASGTTHNVTRQVPVQVWNRLADRPQPRGSYGTAGWTDGDASFLIYDEFDVWEVAPDGSEVRNITEGYGRSNSISFRFWQTDPDADSIDRSETMYFRITDEETMAEGVATDRVRGDREPRVLHLGDYSYGYPRKAEDSDRVLITRQTFYEFPDLWVTDMRFRDFTKISDVGSQREEFIWGRAELMDYIAADGMEYRGILIKPEDFDPSGKYPMMVYIYEKLTSGLHRFRNPGPGTSINPSYYVSNGYLIWMPDIHYGTGHPGRDALDCVVPSVKRVIEEGYVDPERVGLQGHSWGGYQGAYMITQTDIFAAIESGAPVSNMTSAYGGIRWGSGMVRQFQYERTQSRLGRNLWDGGRNRYVENSPLFYTDRISTPVLILHNDEDGAVPWYQGIEWIMALRRLEKPAWMFNYNGEDHGLRRRVNQEDYTVRMQQFFDHYLKGAPMPDWMEHGIQAWKKEK